MAAERRNIQPKPLPLLALHAAQRIDVTEALNRDGEALSLPSAQIAEQIKRTSSRLLVTWTDAESGRVAYDALAGSAEFREYVTMTAGLRRFDLKMLKDSRERMAFWINLYNGLIIHAVVAYKAQKTIQEVRGVFDRAAYIVGGLRFSANDIEHGVLRSNTRHPARLARPFRRDDPRRAFALDTLDPRVHFALVCAANSCPPIGWYEASRLDEQLELAARHFLNSGQVVLDRATMSVALSRLFSWYAADFGAAWFGYRGQAKLLGFVVRYLENADDRDFIERHAARLKVRFLPYDWMLNTDV